MITYKEELNKKNKTLKEKIKSSKEELEDLKKELKYIEDSYFTLNTNSNPINNIGISDNFFRVDAKVYITEDSFPIQIESKNENFKITLEDVYKIRTLLDRKPWYKRVWAAIQKIWKKETKN